MRPSVPVLVCGAFVAALVGCAIANVDPDAGARGCGGEGLRCCADPMGFAMCDDSLECNAAKVCVSTVDGDVTDDVDDVSMGDDVSDEPQALDAVVPSDASSDLPTVDVPRDVARPDVALDRVTTVDLPATMDLPVAMDLPVTMDLPLSTDACAPPRVQCADRCADLTSSSMHCGACGNACPVAQQCVSGRCMPCGALGQSTCAVGGCLTGLMACGGACRDTATDAQNCGMCARACAMGMRCEAGTCRAAGSVFVTPAGSFARAADGTLRAWGTNSGGQLGDGTVTARLAPVPTMAPMNAEEIVGGSLHSCARLTDGSVSCWGTNSVGQCGVGPTSTSPRLVPSTVTGVTGVTSIAAGTSHTCAVRGDGTVACWGNNLAGQLGTGDTTARTTPTSVVGLSGTFLAVTAGLNHTCARRTDGAVFCWGQNTNGQLGNGATTGMGPVMVAGVTAVEVAAGYLNTCVRLADGSVRCWGQNGYGQVGDGTTTTRATPTVVRLAAPAAEVRVGAAFACARLMTQAIQCWGYNTNGALGDGTTTTRGTAGNVVGITDATTLAVSNSSHACARLASGGLRCWGYNRLGQVGDGTSISRTSPVPIAGL